MVNTNVLIFLRYCEKTRVFLHKPELLEIDIEL